jgi:hypothetical protein
MTNHDKKYQVLLTVTVPSEQWCLVKDTHILLQDIMPKYFIDFKIQTLDKLKLPPITDSVYTTRDEFDKHKGPNRM